jgi:acyl carrier protein
MQEAYSPALYAEQRSQAQHLFHLFAQIRSIICIEWGLVALDVMLDSRLYDDLGADPVGMVEVAMAMEEAFDIAISDERLEQVETVRDLVLLADRLG